MKKVALSLLIVVLLFSGIIVFAQTQLDLTYQLDCNVTSTTALWNPGTHDFTMTCQGQLFTPINTLFSLNGSGNVTYSMVGGGPPPGELDLSMSLSGYLYDTFFDGPFNLTVVAHATTVLVSPNVGFERTEIIQNLTANGIFNAYTWDVTNQSATADFSFIDPQGKTFQFRITGGGPASYIPEFSSLIILPLFIIATIVVITLSKKPDRKQNS